MSGQVVVNTETCPDCGGGGIERRTDFGRWVECPTCGGRGWVPLLDTAIPVMGMQDIRDHRYWVEIER